MEPIQCNESNNTRPIPRRPRQRELRLRYGVDIGALLAALLVFSTGLILLTRFHMGSGSIRAEALGMARFFWVSIHRLSALALACTLVVHGTLHWQTIVARVSRAWSGILDKGDRVNLVLYYCFVVVVLTGMLACFVIPGSPPLYEPVAPTPLPDLRHLTIDLHNFSSVGLLVATIIHLRRHMRWIIHTTWRRQRAV